MRRDGLVESCLGCKIAMNGCSESERVGKDKVERREMEKGLGRTKREPQASVAQCIPMNGYLLNSGTLS
jgi:hypothetical protein